MLKLQKAWILVITVILVGVSFSVYSLLKKPAADFIVGGKGFTEQYIIAGLLTAELEEAGFIIDQRLGLGTEVIYQATANEMVDIYLEYSGTVWANRMNETSNPGRQTVLAKVGDFVQENDGMYNVGPLGFQNLYALAMRKDRAAELGIETIDDMIPIANNLVAAGDLEFFGRPEWITLRDTYNIDFAEKLTFDTALMYTAVDRGQVDVITASTSDGRMDAYNLKIIADPRNSLLPYDGMLIASASAAKNPLFLEIVGGLVNRISDETMREANRIVDVNGGSITDAVNYLRGMIR